MIKNTKLFLFILMFIGLSIGTYSFGYNSNFWMGGGGGSNGMGGDRTRDGFLLSAEEEYGFLPTTNQFGESCSTGVTQGGNIESRCDPRIKYFTKYLGNGHLNIGNSIKNKVPLYRRDVSSGGEINDARVVVEETDMLLGGVRCTAEDWLNLTEGMRYPVYQVSDPTNTGKIREMLNAQKFTTRPVRKGADDNLKFYWKSESADGKGNYHMVDYGATKNGQPIEINKEGTQTKNIGGSNGSKYRAAFALSMRSVLHGDGQINFHLRGKFNNYGYLEENPITNTDYSTSTGLDGQAFYIANGTYKLNGTTMKGNGKSAVTAGRNHGLYFRSLPNYGASTNLDDLQRGFRPQLVWALPFIKVHVGVGTENFTFYTNFYDPRTGNGQLNTHKNKGRVWDGGEMVYDGKFAEDRKRDENGFSSKFQGQGYYADASKIGLSGNEGGITWENSLYRLGSWKFQDTVLSGMIYRIDDRYSYFLDVGFCGDGFLQDYAGEECDLGIGNGEGSTCSNTCKKQENLCGNGIIDTAAGEECDYKIFETMYVDKLSPLWLGGQTGLIYSGKNNPCYSPDDKAEFEAIGRKACQWKKPQGNITLEPYDKELTADNSTDIRNIVITDLPYYASINSCQWYNPKVVDKYGTNFDKLPYILTYPFVNENFHEQVTGAYSKITVPYESLNTNQIKILKGLNSNCNIDMKKNYADQIQKIGGINDSLTKEELNVEGNLRQIWFDNGNTIKVGSILTNNVAAAYGYDPKSPNINTFINNSGIGSKPLADGYSCQLNVNITGENLFDIQIKIGKIDPSTNKFIEVDSNSNEFKTSNANFKFEGLGKTLSQKANALHNKVISITSPITKNETIKGTITNYQEDGTTIENYCNATLKFDPQGCYTGVSNGSGINNPSTGNPFDANVGIYSF